MDSFGTGAEADRPDERPAEGDPTEAIAEAGAGEDFGDGLGEAVAPPPPPPPPPAPVVEDKPIPLTVAPDNLVVPVAAASNPQPVYPEAARKKGIEGDVILKITISTTGQVTAVKVVKGDPVFSEAAVAMVKTWRYKPAMLDGKPVAVSRLVNVQFRSRS